MEYILYALFLVGGFFIGYLIYKNVGAKKLSGSEQKAKKLLDEAALKEKEILLQAQEKALKVIEDSKKEEAQRRQEINQAQARVEERENSFSQKLIDLQEKQQKLYDQVAEVQNIKDEIKTVQQEQEKKLAEIADLSPEGAKEVLLKKIEAQCSDDLAIRLKKLENEGDERLADKARDIMALAMQRTVSNYTVELTTTTVDLPNDEMKGRIIGREGRNIKSIEQLTGTEIIVDDTPNAITISGFSLIRRHIAKKTLDYLIKDGRIHPTKIEDAVENAKKDIATDIKKAGEEALYEVGVAGFDPKLVQIIGRLKYRTSYGQNTLHHSVEVAQLAAILAEELGADVTLAKKGGLLHDIGKAVDHEVQGTHTEIGRDISVIVKVADAISSARPGARSDNFENYIQRLEELEKIASSFEGVEKTYAIQAGREVRVFVRSEEMSDLDSHNLARDIAQKIETELKYPGEIKVNVIRELRVTEYAR
jgi:ribonuclease Y